MSKLIAMFEEECARCKTVTVQQARVSANKYGTTYAWTVRKPSVAPTGWHLFNGKPYCAGCTQLIEKAITPVSSPTGDETR